MSLSIPDLLNLKQTEHALLFRNCKHPWEVLPLIGNYLQKNLRQRIHGRISPLAVIEGPVFIGAGTVVEPHAYIKGPAWIGRDCEVRQGAYIRGNVIAGNGCILGNSCEFKNSVLFNNCQVPHFSYVGDSVLGYRAHLGSGVTLSNFKITPGNIVVISDGKKISTGLRKFGAIIGDEVEIGCHSVLNPGSIIGRKSIFYAGISWRGICPSSTVVKLKQVQILKTRKEGRK